MRILIILLLLTSLVYARDIEAPHAVEDRNVYDYLLKIKLKLDNLVTHAHGSLYMHEDAVTINLVQNNYAVIHSFDEGTYHDITPSSDSFVIIRAGIYKVNWSLSGKGAGGSQDIEIDPFINGVEQSDGTAQRKFGAAADLGNVGGTALYELIEDDELDLRAKNVTSSNDMTLTHANFNVIRIGDIP